MVQQGSDKTQISRESGAVLHRRETNWQIYVPFIFGIAILIIIFLVMALPSDSLWRVRAQAIGDFLYTLLCIFPILVCLLPLYIALLLGIYGMKKVHEGTERPLRKLENLTEDLASRVETATEFVREQTSSLNKQTEPLSTLTNIFDTPNEMQDEETISDE